ncbi:MAG: hypothetical protein IPM51_15810 [Sphingobacteriaceae bacterium]|nr:hypothetical protein [Sphingobacteriaceae bacterium]
MRIPILILSFCFALKLSAQSNTNFKLAGYANNVPIDSLMKHPGITGQSHHIIDKFKVVYNSAQGMAIYEMGGNLFNEELLQQIKKGKPKELHLTITVIENKDTKIYKDIPFQLIYK